MWSLMTNMERSALQLIQRTLDAWCHWAWSNVLVTPIIFLCAAVIFLKVSSTVCSSPCPTFPQTVRLWLYGVLLWKETREKKQFHAPEDLMYKQNGSRYPHESHKAFIRCSAQLNSSGAIYRKCIDGYGVLAFVKCRDSESQHFQNINGKIQLSNGKSHKKCSCIILQMSSPCVSLDKFHWYYIH